MTVEWLEHVDLPDGQAADLLRRYPYERATAIELAREHDMGLTQSLFAEGGSKARVLRMTRTGFASAVLKASLWNSTTEQCPKPHLLRNGLTGDPLPPGDVSLVSNKTGKTLRDHALENYANWSDEAYPGPKDSTGTDSQTPSTAIPESSDQTTPEPTPSEIAA